MNKRGFLYLGGFQLSWWPAMFPDVENNAGNPRQCALERHFIDDDDDDDDENFLTACSCCSLSYLSALPNWQSFIVPGRSVRLSRTEVPYRSEDRCLMNFRFPHDYKCHYVRHKDVSLERIFMSRVYRNISPSRAQKRQV